MKICITYYVAESVEVLHFKTCWKICSSEMLQNNEWFLRLWGKAKPCLFVQRKPVPVMCSMMSRRFWTTRQVLTPKWRPMADWWALAVWCAAVSKSPFWGCQESWNGVFHYQPSILGYHKSWKPPKEYKELKGHNSQCDHLHGTWTGRSFACGWKVGAPLWGSRITVQLLLLFAVVAATVSAYLGCKSYVIIQNLR